MTRIFVSESLRPSQELTLPTDAAHHIRTVLRHQRGDKIELFNGDGHNYTSVITHLDARQVKTRIEEATPNNADSRLQTHLFQGVCRGERMDWLVQKAVEVGVSHITPVLTQFSNVQLNSERAEKKIHHWQKIADSACEQSGRAQRVMIHPLCRFEIALKNCPATAFILEPTLAMASTGDSHPKEVGLFVGPEGGFSPEELAAAKAQGLLPWCLGKRILRTETAGLVALSILQYQYGDLLSPFA